VGPAEAVYVGDSTHDIGCAHAAGVTAVAALWGPYPRPVLEALKPQFMVSSMRELLALFGPSGRR
jgi:phosphoglycolate phosphatase-like HAD superfamily hydrolase